MRLDKINQQLKNELIVNGASIVGFADLSEIPANNRSGLKYGISIVKAIDPGIVNEIGNGPTKGYVDEYHRLNYILDNLGNKAAEIIKSAGFKVLAKSRENVNIDYNNYSTALPHKTIATRAGIGWIGKCALLVTKKFGSAVRITSVLTDAPLEVNQPFNTSNCGNCNNCVQNCPANALNNESWYAGKERERFYNSLACRKAAIERTWKISRGETHCGLCMLVCPYTKKYIKTSQIEYSFPDVDIASEKDLPKILELQKIVYQENAQRYNDFNIQPLTQTVGDLHKEYENSIILKVIVDNKIVGSVRATQNAGNCYIGKLIVHPDYQNKGIGKKLMKAIEKCYKGVRFELFTGNLDEKNLSFYEKIGYKRFKQQIVNDRLTFIYLEKI